MCDKQQKQLQSTILQKGFLPKKQDTIHYRKIEKNEIIL